MSDLRLDPFVRALIADTAVATGQFAVGQQWSGRVVQALSDERFVIMLGELRLLAQSSLPLTPGQRILVEVKSAGNPVELRLRSAVPAGDADPTLRLVSAAVPDAPASAPSSQSVTTRVAEATYDLAAVLNALSALGRQDVPDGDAAARAAAALREAVHALLPPDDAKALTRILQPLSPDRPVAEVAAALRDWLQNGGSLFEAHMRAFLASHPDATAGEALDVLRADLKTLLAKLRPERSVLPPLEARDADDGVAAGSVDVDSKSGTAAREVVAERALGQQIEMAYRWLNEGLLAFEVPVRLADREARALVQFRRERPPEGTPDRDGGRACSISVHVELADLGPVHATARWRQGECEAAFYVGRPAAHDALVAHVRSLEAGLGTIFRKVEVGVILDEARARRPSTAIRPLDPPGGSIVSVRI